MTERALLQQVAPASALVDAHGDICYLHGRTGLYLEPAPGDAGVNNILKMAREGLRRQLSLALHSAVTNRQPVRVADLRVQSEGQVSGVRLSVFPVQTAAWADAAAPLYLVCVAAAPLTESSIDAAARSSDHNGGDSQATIDALRKQLLAKEAAWPHLCATRRTRFTPCPAPSACKALRKTVRPRHDDAELATEPAATER